MQILWKSTQRFLRFRAQKIFYQKFKKPLSNEQFKILKKSKNILANIVFAYIAHAKFQKASFNNNRDIRQNIRGDVGYGGGGGYGGDGGYGNRTQNNTSRRFQKRAGGKNNGLQRALCAQQSMIYHHLHNTAFTCTAYDVAVTPVLMWLMCVTCDRVVVVT